MSKNKKLVNGATFGGKRRPSSFFCPTAMSMAMAKAGIIPDVHLVQENSVTVTVRSRNDTRNLRKSVSLAL